MKLMFLVVLTGVVTAYHLDQPVVGDPRCRYGGVGSLRHS